MNSKLFPSCSIIVIVSVFLTAANVNAQVDLKKLDAYYEKALKDWKVPGMSVAIVKDGKIVFAKGYGVKEVGKQERPDENTLYSIASNTKAFTTAAMAMMVQEQKLSWTDKVVSHLPYFQLYDPYVTQEATVADLLTHRIGLRTFSGDVLWFLTEKADPETLVRQSRHLPKSFNFRSGFGYSNVMYVAAGEIMKKADGKSWGDIIQDRILNPLGMDRSITTIAALNSKGNYAAPHNTVEGEMKPIEWEDWTGIGPTGGIISSVKDMSQWMIFNLNNGIWKTDTLLTRRSRNALWSVQNPFPVDHTDANNATHFYGYSMGWFLQDYYGKLKVFHSGGYPGMVSLVTLIPDEKLGVVVLTNAMKGQLMETVSNYTVDAYLKAPVKDWSADALARVSQAKESPRITERKNARVLNTVPSLALEKYAGSYYSDAYMGNIDVKLENGKLRLSFQHTTLANATLEHWHYDVWKIAWDRREQMAWIGFGTVKFAMDNNLKIQGLEFDVPNDDVWFEELKPHKTR